MGNWTFINDSFVQEQEAKLHYRDLAIQRGYGVFDFFRVRNAQPLFLNEHLDRFYQSAAEMHMDITMSRQQLKSVVNSLLNRNNAQDCGIRLTLTGGYSSDGYQLSSPNLIISQHLFSLPSKEQYDKGISLMLHEHQRQLPQVKTIDYLMAIWLQPELKKHEADDILYHRDGLISECPRANIFMVSGNGRLVTPREHILKGITRHHILALAKEVCEVEERAIDWNELKNAKEVFITSSTKKILPVCRINNITYPSQRPVSKALSLLFDRMEADYAVDNAQETKQSVKEIPH